jgi:hypothetical protein
MMRVTLVPTRKLESYIWYASVPDSSGDPSLFRIAFHDLPPALMSLQDFLIIASAATLFSLSLSVCSSGLYLPSLSKPWSTNCEGAQREVSVRCWRRFGA